MRWAVAVLTLVFAVALTAATVSAQRRGGDPKLAARKNPVAANAASITAGRALYNKNCRHCHDPQAMDNAKQSEDAVKQHKKFASGKATCIDCHTGVAHKEPTEPQPPAKAASGQ